ncbi:MAG: hypothetical protein R3B68_07675 [Phycisphaerales bacterium]
MGYIDPTHFWAFTSSTGDEGEPFDERKDPAWHADLPGPSRFRAGMPVELWDPSMAIEVNAAGTAPRTTPEVLSASAWYGTDPESDREFLVAALLEDEVAGCVQSSDTRSRAAAASRVLRSILRLHGVGSQSSE